MFRSKTTFIVGAGASCEADLPSGERLKTLIGAALDIKFDIGRQQTGDYQIVAALRKATAATGGNINPHLHKAWLIRDVVPVGALSIDNFLDAHRGDSELELCGKLGIVKCILDAEGGSKLRPDRDRAGSFDLASISNTWFLQLLRLLTENVRSDQVESIFLNISFIVFNYDRCIERALAAGIALYYNMPLERAEDLVSKIDIIHPYGSLGPLPRPGLRDAIPFGRSESTDLLPVAGRIKTFSEGMDDADMLRRMKRLTEDSETLVFLGFAFHRQNLELLAPEAPSRVQRVFATTFEVSASDKEHIRNDLIKTLQVEYIPSSMEMVLARDTDIDIEFFDGTCHDLFRSHWRSLSSAVLSSV